MHLKDVDKMSEEDFEETQETIHTLLQLNKLQQTMIEEILILVANYSWQHPESETYRRFNAEFQGLINKHTRIK